MLHAGSLGVEPAPVLTTWGKLHLADWRLWEGESGRWGSGLRHTPHHFYCPPPDTSFPPHIRYQAESLPPTSSSDKMRAHQCRPNLLLLLLLVLVLSTKRASSSTTLSCFSVGLLDLPTFGFNQEKQEEAEDKSEVTIIVEP